MVYIRRANINDLNSIQELNNTLFDLEFNNYDDTLKQGWPFLKDGKEYFEYAIKNELVLVGEVDEKIVGYLAGTINEKGSYENIQYGEINIMFIKDVTVKNQVGLHSRPATFFIQKANEYKSSIWVERDERRVNAKSLLGVLSLGIMGGTNIRIIADGSDEQSAVEGLVKLVESGFEG